MSLHFKLIKILELNYHLTLDQNFSLLAASYICFLHENNIIISTNVKKLYVYVFKKLII